MRPVLAVSIAVVVAAGIGLGVGFLVWGDGEPVDVGHVEAEVKRAAEELGDARRVVCVRKERTDRTFACTVTWPDGSTDPIEAIADGDRVTADLSEADRFGFGPQP